MYCNFLISDFDFSVETVSYEKTNLLSDLNRDFSNRQRFSTNRIITGSKRWRFVEVASDISRKRGEHFSDPYLGGVDDENQFSQ